MGWDEKSERIALKRDFQQVPGVQSKDGTPIRADVADGSKLVREFLCGL